MVVVPETAEPNGKSQIPGPINSLDYTTIHHLVNFNDHIII
jgi:hypothetical protein